MSKQSITGIETNGVAHCSKYKTQGNGGLVSAISEPAENEPLHLQIKV